MSPLVSNTTGVCPCAKKGVQTEYWATNLTQLHFYGKSPISIIRSLKRIAWISLLKWFLLFSCCRFFQSRVINVLGWIYQKCWSPRTAIVAQAKNLKSVCSGLTVLLSNEEESTLVFFQSSAMHKCHSNQHLQEKSRSWTCGRCGCTLHCTSFYTKHNSAA